MKNFPIELIWATVAVMGGVARYLNSYVNGHHFRLSILVASAVVAGFSGMMFALFAESMKLPSPMPHIFAGMGGFFGEQTLKFIMENITKTNLTKHATSHKKL
jgi:hypothetical protein